ncbi:MAG TPA: metallophosphoesterase [Candidatus Eremiobacteraeota bacterium]|nr:MAG: Calcineurin-like phosphoesterase superfamily domain protein [bacterium ADurb.Bin363]HPZ07290.1 metallophosphoesterase [Candidatus Eremiobacteraeota bacterium]
MIKKVNKIIAISDIHLGEKDCLFNDSKILGEFKKHITEEAKHGSVDELLILGDMFDLSLASYKDVYAKAREFFQSIGEIENLKAIVFIPGNHDHHIWTLLIEEEQITGIIREGKIPSPELKRVDLEYGEKESIFLQGLLKGCMVNKFLVAYPNIFREIGGKLYFFHHGHLLDRIFTPANIILKPKSLQELEAFNSSWIEGIWYHLVQAERLGELIKDGYNEFTGFKAVMASFLEKFHIRDNTVTGRLRGLRVEKLKSEISTYLEDCINWYKETPNTLYSPMNFVFGHTHEKSSGEILDVKGQEIGIYNTGAWHGDIKLASYLVIEGEKKPELKSL